MLGLWVELERSLPLDVQRPSGSGEVMLMKDKLMKAGRCQEPLREVGKHG